MIQLFKFYLIISTVLSFTMSAYGQYNMHRNLYLNYFKQPGIEIKSLLAIVSPTQVNDCSMYKEEIVKYKIKDTLVQYKYTLGALHTTDNNKMYCSRIVKNELDTTYIYIYTGKNDKPTFDIFAISHIQDLFVDSFNISKGTYLINLYDKQSKVNKEIAKNLDSMQTLKKGELKPLLNKFITIKKAINTYSQKRSNNDIQKKKIKDTLAMLNLQYITVEEGIDAINKKYTLKNYKDYYYFDSLGFHITSKAMNSQKISTSAISPEIIKTFIKYPITAQPIPIKKIMRVFKLK